MFVIFNKDGSIFAKTQSDFVMQGSNRVNKIFVGFVDNDYTNWTCNGVFNLPNSTRWTIPAVPVVNGFDYLGVNYKGWQIELTDDVTKYDGKVNLTVQLVNAETNVLYTYLASITINKTGLPVDGYWDESITVAQFNDYMAQLAIKLQANTVSVELKEEDLPAVGEKNVLYFIVGASSNTPYQVKMWNGSEYVPLGTINLSSFASREEQADFEVHITELQAEFEENINNAIAQIRSEVTNPLEVVQTVSDLPSENTGKIYVVTADNHWYYWDGSTYVDSGNEFVDITYLDAINVNYNNSTSGLDTTNVQDAIDGLKDFVVNDNLACFKNVRLSGTTNYLYDDWIYIPYSKLTTNILTMIFSNQAQENIVAHNLNIAYYNEAKEKISDHGWVAGYWLTSSEFNVNLTPPENTYYVGVQVFCRGDTGVQKFASVDIDFLNGTERKISLNEDIKVSYDSVFSLDSSNAIKNSSITKYIVSNDNEKLLEVLKASFVNGKRWIASNVGDIITYGDATNSAASSKLIFDKDVLINRYKENGYSLDVYKIDENGIVLSKDTYRESFEFKANNIYVIRYRIKDEQDSFEKAINGLDVVNDDLEPYKDLYVTYGAINTDTGVYSFGTTSNRIVTYALPTENIEYITIDNGSNDKFLYINCYDENNNFLGNAGNNLDGFQLFSKKYILRTFPTTKYIRLLFGLDDETQPELSAFNQYVDLYFTKEGLEKYKQEQEKILLQRAKFDKKFQSIAYSKTRDNTAPINSKQQYIAAGKNVGYTAIKGDIRITSDDRLVMCHDAGYTFDTNGRIIAFDESNYTPIRTLTYAQVMALEFAQQYEGQYVHPTDIDGLLQTCKKYGKMPFVTVREEYIDIYVPILISKLKEYYLEEECIVNSYIYETIKEVRKYSDKIMVSQVQPKDTIPNLGVIDSLNDLGNTIICFVIENYSIFDNETTQLFLQKLRDVKMRYYNAIVGENYEFDILIENAFAGTQTYIPFIEE